MNTFESRPSLSHPSPSHTYHVDMFVWHTCLLSPPSLSSSENTFLIIITTHGDLKQPTTNDMTTWLQLSSFLPPDFQYYNNSRAAGCYRILNSVVMYKLAHKSRTEVIKLIDYGQTNQKEVCNINCTTALRFQHKKRRSRCE